MIHSFAFFFLGANVLLLVNLLVTSWVLGRLDGWMDLAACYGTRMPFPHQRHHFVTGSVAGFDTRNNLDVAIGPQGLFLAATLLFRPSHPPICIPWHAVQAAYRHKRAWTDRMRLMVTNCTGTEAIPILLPTDLLLPARPYLPPVEHDPGGYVLVWPVVFYWLGMTVVSVACWFGLLWLAGHP